MLKGVSSSVRKGKLAIGTFLAAMFLNEVNVDLRNIIEFNIYKSSCDI